MGMFEGTMNVALLRIRANPHESKQEIIAAANRRIAPPLEAAERVEKTIGFAPGKALLLQEITEENSLIEDAVALHVRKTEMRLDPGLLKAEMQRKKYEYKRSMNEPLAGKKMMDIKATATAALKDKKRLSVKGVEIAILSERGWVVVGSTGASDADDAICCLGAIGIRCTSTRGRHSKTRRKFLTWLYRESIDRVFGDRIFVDIGGPFVLSAIDPADASAEPPPEITEAKIDGAARGIEIDAMLDRKKLIRKCDLTITRDGKRWSFRYDADALTIGRLSLPKEDEERFRTRLESVFELVDIMDELFIAWRDETEKEAGIRELPNIDNTNGVETHEHETD